MIFIFFRCYYSVQTQPLYIFSALFYMYVLCKHIIGALFPNKPSKHFLCLITPLELATSKVNERVENDVMFWKYISSFVPRLPTSFSLLMFFAHSRKIPYIYTVNDFFLDTNNWIKHNEQNTHKYYDLKRRSLLFFHDFSRGSVGEWCHCAFMMVCWKELYISLRNIIKKK